MELTLRGATDTAHPQPVVPVYLIHSLEQPFCDRQRCWCQQGKAQITPILAALKTGSLLLSDAADFSRHELE